MSKFRKRPVEVVIEAYQFTAAVEREWNEIDSNLAYDNIVEIEKSAPLWFVRVICGNSSKNSIWCERDEVDFDKRHWMCGTLEGPYQITIDDWIIQGVQGEIYPCKPDIFEARFEAVDEVVS